MHTQSSKIEKDIIHIRMPRVLPRWIQPESRIPPLVLFDPLDNRRLPSLLRHPHLRPLQLVVALIRKLPAHPRVVRHQPGSQKTAAALAQAIGVVRRGAVRDAEGGAGVGVAEIVCLWGGLISFQRALTMGGVLKGEADLRDFGARLKSNPCRFPASHSGLGAQYP